MVCDLLTLSLNQNAEKSLHYSLLTRFLELIHGQLWDAALLLEVSLWILSTWAPRSLCNIYPLWKKKKEEEEEAAKVSQAIALL